MDRVGVLHGLLSCIAWVPKKELLLFDRLAIVSLEDVLDLHRKTSQGDPEIADQLEWMEERGLLVRAHIPPRLTVNAWSAGFLDKSMAEMIDRQRGGARFYGEADDPKKLADRHREVHLTHLSLMARESASYLTSRGQVTAVSAERVPVGEFARMFFKRDERGEREPTSDVMQVVLKNIPTPSELTSFDDLLTFKKDPEVRRQLVGLRIWMAEVAKAQLSRAELEDKLEWLLREYERHMGLHRLKVRCGAVSWRR